MVQAYDALNMQELLIESERLEQQGAGGDFMKDLVRMPEKAGFVVVRILPPGKGKKLYCATRIHKVNDRNVHCPRVLTVTPQGKTFWRDADPKNPCPICRYNSEIWKETGASSDVRAFDRYYYNVIVRKEIDPKTNEVHENVGPKILSIGVQLHERIVRAIVGDKNNDEKGLGDVTDIKNGRDFKIIKNIRPGKDAFPEYNESKFLDPSPLGDKDQCDLWLNSLHDLAALRVLKPLEEMKVELQKHCGVIPKDDDSSFNINDFRKPTSDAPQSLEDQVEQVVAKSQAAAATPSPTATAPPKGEPLVAKEFLDELNKIKPPKP